LSPLPVARTEKKEEGTGEKSPSAMKIPCIKK
jgi:hypothetical protein